MQHVSPQAAQHTHTWHTQAQQQQRASKHARAGAGTGRTGHRQARTREGTAPARKGGESQRETDSPQTGQGSDRDSNRRPSANRAQNPKKLQSLGAAWQHRGVGRHLDSTRTPGPANDSGTEELIAALLVSTGVITKLRQALQHHECRQVHHLSSDPSTELVEHSMLRGEGLPPGCALPLASLHSI